MKKLNSRLFLIIQGVFLVIFLSCQQGAKKAENYSQPVVYQDVPFVQESHDAFKISDNPADNEVRSIAVDHESNIWIATASGIFCKHTGSREWKPVISGEERGPAYSVVVNINGDVLMGVWNGVYRFSNQKLKKEAGVKPPISVICNDGSGNYALGPYGIWRFTNNKWEHQDYAIARTVRDAITDGKAVYLLRPMPDFTGAKMVKRSYIRMFRN